MQNQNSQRFFGMPKSACRHGTAGPSGRSQLARFKITPGHWVTDSTAKRDEDALPPRQSGARKSVGLATGSAMPSVDGHDQQKIPEILHHQNHEHFAILMMQYLGYFLLIV